MKTTKPSILFCHGIWADGSSFGKVIPPLQADGYEVMAAQYGLDTPEGDVAPVKRTLGRVSGPTILVGHSYGGSVITAAGTDDRVVGLGLHRRSCSRRQCRRNIAKPAGAVPTHRCLQVRRTGGWAPVDEAGRRHVLRGRPLGGRAKACVGDPLCPGSRSLQPECSRCRLEVEA